MPEMAVDTSALDRLSAEKAARDALRDSPSVTKLSGGGPTEPPIDRRVAALEGDLKDVKASIQAIQMSQARMEGIVSGLATKADVASLKGSVDTVTARVDAQIVRISALETANTGTINLALSKTVGVAGAFGLFISIGVVMTLVITVLRYFQLFP